MAVAGVSFNGIVPELLTNDNYEKWSVLMKNYLMGHGLWGVVLSNPNTNNEEWQMKNAMALYAIQLSCGPHAFYHVQSFDNAKAAWNQLTLLFRKCEADLIIELGISDDDVAVEDGKESSDKSDELFWEKVDQLYQNLKSGKWEEAKSCIDENPSIPFSQDSSGKTILHIAVKAKQELIVEKLIDLVEEKENLLKMKDDFDYTALDLAATLTDSTRMAKCMVEKCQDLLTMKKERVEIPVLLASANGHKDMTRYLYSQTRGSEEEVRRYGGVLLTQCIKAEIFDVALDLLRRLPQVLASEQIDLQPILYGLAQMPAVFPSGSQRKNWWRRIFYKILTVKSPISKISYADQHVGLLQRVWMSRIKEIYEEKLNHHLLANILKEMMTRISKFNQSELRKVSAYNAILMAAKQGTIELVRSMRKANPHLLLARDECNRAIITYAIQNHRLDLLDDMYELLEGKKCDHKDTFGNNMLHLAAESRPSSHLHGRSSCAALRMQRELQLFKMVENMVPPDYKKDKNRLGQTPSELFIESHKELAEAAEKWARRSATSFSVVGTLIITIMFAAVFTVPGGYNQETGIPILLNRSWLEVFIIADAISLFLSTASVLIFVGILSSRYSEKDFVATLPSKLVTGVFILFLSVVSMVVTFGAALNLMLRRERNIVIIAMVFACIPIVAFVTTQLPLFIEFFNSSVTNDLLRFILKVF